jgi:hypothetical protein
MVSICTFERPSLELLHEGKYMVHWTPCDSNRLQDYPDEAQTSVEVEGCAYHLQLATDKENIRFELLVRKIGGNAPPMWTRSFMIENNLLYFSW